MTHDAAIVFEPDGYVLAGPKLMGRQAAGHAFLRAMVRGRAGPSLFAYTPSKKSAQIFAEVVKGLDARCEPRWVSPARAHELESAGALYSPGPVLGAQAAFRLRLGPLAYSLVGVTHTTASHAVMDAVAGFLTAPLMPWDAVICTSDAVVKTLEEVIEAERAYLSWKFGREVPRPDVQLPVIPLGVHGADFEFSIRDKRLAREGLGIGKDDVVALFVGRLSFHGKAHPFPMYIGLEETARRTGKKIVLIQCGWFANESIEAAFKDGAKRFAPSVRAIFTDGKDETARNGSWAAADLFVSMSDNIQETFGLAPIEAMAAGLPVVVTDWDGYKETVRDGIDGFRIPTFALPDGLGQDFAQHYETGVATYDQYCGLTCRTVSVDIRLLVEKLALLVADPELRRTMGASGKQAIRATFDWSHIYRRYQRLYDELAVVRAKAAEDKSLVDRLALLPDVSAARLDPFRLFSHYPSETIGPETTAELLLASATGETYAAIARHALFSYMPEALPNAEGVTRLLAYLAKGPSTIKELAAAMQTQDRHVMMALAVLAKMALVRLSR